jgi:hypothetical protein
MVITSRTEVPALTLAADSRRDENTGQPARPRVRARRPEALAVHSPGANAIVAALLVALRPRRKWDVIHDAIGDTRRTIRLVAVIVATTLPPCAVTLLVALLTHH